jgi:hypothetical protein
MTAHTPITSFPQIEQSDVGGKLAQVYDDMQFTLRMPWSHSLSG